ncbi:hypothetical protein [Klenkia sp. PcliD-1-E]|uniref:hypothetical protein n=1 Tax=Klenkia sp. PcliD-1-E TaxID=2954492 RepID=UPI002096D67A|nr:hypothetical protein [Klenkia sp. PcliD-1-E]MCO7219506.1 hypothetical protein [Klenkia sp. PcliD-1-E]
MDLTELLTTIATTPASGWSQLSPPTLTQIKTAPGDQLQVWLSGHDSVAYLRSNLDVSVAWGAEHHKDPWTGVWARWSTLPDRTVRGMYAEVLWRGRPVHRQLLAVADGGRHYLPRPSPLMAPNGDDVDEWVVDQNELPLARLINSLVNRESDVDSTLRMLDIRVRS